MSATIKLCAELEAIRNTSVSKHLKVVKRKHLGVYWKANSALDGQPIYIALQLSKSANEKIGDDMRQVWIMPANSKPTEAHKNGDQDSVCGKCWFKSSNTCYVNLQTPNSIYAAIENGRYLEVDINNQEDNQYVASVLFGTHTRLGAWGDPAAMPWSICELIANSSTAITAYTHQVSHPNFDKRFLKVCMVSIETAKQAAKYQAQGVRTFRPMLEGGEQTENEITCINESHGITCSECRLCDGATASRGNVSITVTIHGRKGSDKKFANKFGKSIEVVNL